MQFFLGISALLISYVYGEAAIGTSVKGWTYKTTPSTCAATNQDPCGPSNWVKVSGSQTCGVGSAQSPIDISGASVAVSSPKPVFTAAGSGCKLWTQFSNNYTFEVAFNEGDYKCTGLTTTISNTVYTLQQIHFHSPSEHTVGGGHYDGEAHFVHKSAAGNIVVFGVFLQASGQNLGSSNNTFLDNFWSVGQEDGTLMKTYETPVSTNVAINPYHGFFPGNSGRYIYKGSLTTPPCTEGVTFHIFDTPVVISHSDLAILRKTALGNPFPMVSQDGNSNRPTQELNGRTVTYVPATATDSSTTTDDYTAAESRHNAIVAIVLAVIALGVLAVLICALIITCSIQKKQYRELSTKEAAKKPTEDTEVAL